MNFLISKNKYNNKFYILFYLKTRDYIYLSKMRLLMVTNN